MFQFLSLSTHYICCFTSKYSTSFKIKKETSALSSVSSVLQSLHNTVLSISFEVDIPTGKVGGFLSAEDASFLRGFGGMPPPQMMLGSAIVDVFWTALGP